MSRVRTALLRVRVDVDLAVRTPGARRVFAMPQHTNRSENGSGSPTVKAMPEVSTVVTVTTAWWATRGTDRRPIAGHRAPAVSHLLSHFLSHFLSHLTAATVTRNNRPLTVGRRN